MIRQIARAWNRYWFSPEPLPAVVYPRLAICCVAAIWFGSFLTTSTAWFSESGLLNTTTSEKLLQFEQSPGWQNWSPLWLTDNPTLITAWLIVGMVLSLLCAFGIGGRISWVVLLLWVIAWAHRLMWLQGLVEPALVAAIAYMIIEPGAGLWKEQPRWPSWRAGVALRLLRTHWWLLVAAGLMSQLASLIWWRGEGVWWLASAGRSHLFAVETLRGHPVMINALSHAVIAVQVLALWLILVPAARPMGIACGFAVAGVYGLIADQTLYAALLSAMLVSYIGKRT